MQNVTLQRVPASRATSLLITSALIAVPTTTAYAVTLEDAHDFITSSHWISFGTGCLVGAVTGGFLVGIVASRKRRRALRASGEAGTFSPSSETPSAVSDTGVFPKFDDIVGDNDFDGKEVDSNEVVKDMEPDGKVVHDKEVVDDKEPDNKVVVDYEETEYKRPDGREVVEDEEPDGQEPDGNEVVEDEEPDGAGVVEDKVADDSSSIPLVENQTSVDAPEVTQNAKTGQGKHASKKEKTPLQDASSTRAREKYPTIDRGKAREGDAPTFVSSSYFAKRPRETARRFNPEVRAAIINRRLPRFDESLYPDTTDIMAHDGDMFETAMRAMEDSLMHPETYFDHGPAFTPDYAQGTAPNGFDASAYVESIMQDELERSRSHHAQRFSHVHLTVYDGTGTGDLDSTHKHRQYRPRHLRAASREA